MYIRDKDRFEFKDQEMDHDFFMVPEICSVLYVAKLIRETEGDIKMPQLFSSDLEDVPEAVPEEVDRILKQTLELIEQCSIDGKDISFEIKMGNIHPVGDIVNSPEMKQALGEVIMSRLGSYERLTGERAYERAKEIYPEIRDKLEMIFEGFMRQAYNDLTKQAREINIPLTDISNHLESRLVAIDPDKGFIIEVKVDNIPTGTSTWTGSTDPSYI